STIGSSRTSMLASCSLHARFCLLHVRFVATLSQRSFHPLTTSKPYNLKTYVVAPMRNYNN
ncbi:MAG: hypothetical protein J6R91_04415, partial [Bacteroidaceae bacterium]|nr:hypothetical protein [Bacteroidaceae bacterium]